MRLIHITDKSILLSGKNKNTQNMRKKWFLIGKLLFFKLKSIKSL